MTLELNDKIILITGGATGIGAATARLCAERGAAIIIADFNADDGETTAAAIRDAGGSAGFVRTDVRDPAQVEALMSGIQAQHGRLDAMVLAAGVLLGPWQQPEELSVEDYERTVDVNTKGVFLCAKYGSALLETAGGVMIVVASPAGVRGASSSLAYAASKGGANGLAMTLEARLADRGVRVNTIYPGSIVTNMKLSVDITRAQQEGRSVEEEIARANREYGQPEGVAKVIAFMLSDEADYLRGGLYTR